MRGRRRRFSNVDSSVGTTKVTNFDRHTHVMHPSDTTRAVSQRSRSGFGPFAVQRFIYKSTCLFARRGFSVTMGVCDTSVSLSVSGLLLCLFVPLRPEVVLGRSLQSSGARGTSVLVTPS